MKIDFFQVDAFTNQLFAGNPAAVCPLEAWPDTELLQNIAFENNLAETSFVVPISKNTFHLRWFTPEIEMDLCGHGTLAAAFVLFKFFHPPGDKIHFETASGLLTVSQKGDFLEMDFPARPPRKADLPAIISEGFSIPPKEVWKARDYLLVYEKEEDIKNIVPNRALLDQINIDPGGIIVTAKGKEVDFVSRLFTPQASVFEDPVTGSAHCTLVPFWGTILGKKELHARQISARGGELFCEWKGDRVFLKGQAVLFLRGSVFL